MVIIPHVADVGKHIIDAAQDQIYLIQQTLIDSARFKLLLSINRRHLPAAAVNTTLLPTNVYLQAPTPWHAHSWLRLQLSEDPFMPKYTCKP